MRTCRRLNDRSASVAEHLGSAEPRTIGAIVTTIEEELAIERRRVDVDTNNFPVRELVRMLRDGELNISPAYQRKFRWTEETESALIESVFLGLPIPSIFVATNEGFEWEVVDGLQRLSTLAHFMATDETDLQRIGRTAPLKLAGLSKVEALNGHSYEELPDPLKIYFGRQPLQITALTDKSDLKVRFDLFERLNRGAIALSEQEVRACLYGGEFISLIDDLAVGEAYKSLLKLQPAKQADGTAEEVVLKYFAYKNNREHFTGRVRLFLNDFMDDVTKHPPIEEARSEFEGVATALAGVLEGQPYIRSDYHVTPLVQLEATLVAVGELLDEGKTIQAADAAWRDDPDLKAASMGGTNTKTQLNARIDRAKSLLSAG